MKEIKKIKFTRGELKWIERTADIESTRIFQNFSILIRDADKLTEEGKKLMDKQVTELMDLYTFLKILRSKLELWDCRYDIDTELETEVK